jgi:hypothetical protein
MRSVILALAIVLLAVVVVVALGRELRAVHALHDAPVASSATASVPSAVADPQRPPPSLPAPSPPSRDTHAKMQQSIAAAVEARAPELHDERDLLRYFDDLEAQARRNGDVGALEVEPGLRAARGLGSRLPPGRGFELAQQFSARMAALSAQLDGHAAARPSPLETMMREHKRQLRSATD